jgi:ubiquinone/menaquinone biosynthesis C-methylase UbiE
MKTKISEAIDANIAVHSAMANEYNKVEPHFRPESIKRVKEIISELSKKTPLTNALDLGCGTGFMIDILKGFSSKIVGVDVTQPMLDKVDMSGPAQIELINSDTGSVKLTENYFDIATAYTFLDHLYDLKPTLINTYNSLRPGGVFYADLSPNFYFWQEVKSLNTAMEYDSIVQREVNAVLRKD